MQAIRFHAHGGPEVLRCEEAPDPDYYAQEVAEEIRRLTNRRGVDVVIDHVGGATRPKSVRSLARGGRLVTCGAAAGAHGALDLHARFAKRLWILGSHMGAKGELPRAARFFFTGALTPVVDRTCPLADAAGAKRRLEAFDRFGKIVHEVP
jgi:NADPH:quinone reductase-like Zn-dependent oxidoreductase